MEYPKLVKLKNLYQPSAIQSNPTLRNHSVTNNWGEWLESIPLKNASTSSVLHDASIDFAPKFVFTQNSWRGSAAIGREIENFNEVPTFEILKSRVKLSTCRDWLFLNPSNSGARLNPFSIRNAGISVERLQDDVFRALFPFNHILPTLFDEEIDFHLDRLFDEEAERRRVNIDQSIACRPMRSFPFYHLGHVDYEFTPFPFNHFFFLSNIQTCLSIWERRAKKRMVEEHRHRIFSSFLSRSPLSPYHLSLPFLFTQTEVPRAHARFVLKERLGKGSFGIVHRVVDTQTRKEYACKSFPKKDCRERSEAEKMRREIQREEVMERANCVHVVGLEMVVEDSKGVHMVMELCRGGSLRDLLRGIEGHGVLHEEVVKKAVMGLMFSLNYCHAMGVMHSDIKPDNVLLTYGFGYDATDLPEFKLGDFGAGLVHTEAGWEDCRMGTVGYLAPECCLRLPFDQAADLWSVGAGMYQMLVGRLPYQGSRFEELASNFYSQPLDLVAAPWKQVSDEAKDLVRAFLSPEPAERPRLGNVMKHPWIAGEGGDAAWVDPYIIWNDEFSSSFRIY